MDRERTPNIGFEKLSELILKIVQQLNNATITPRYKIDELTIVEYGLLRASIGPEAIESKMPYISTFPAKLCSMHLQKAIDIIKAKIYAHHAFVEI